MIYSHTKPTSWWDWVPIVSPIRCAADALERYKHGQYAAASLKAIEAALDSVCDAMLLVSLGTLAPIAVTGKVVTKGTSMAVTKAAVVHGTMKVCKEGGKMAAKKVAQQTAAHEIAVHTATEAAEKALVEAGVEWFETRREIEKFVDKLESVINEVEENVISVHEVHNSQEIIQITTKDNEIDCELSDDDSCLSEFEFVDVDGLSETEDFLDATSK